MWVLVQIGEIGGNKEMIMPVKHHKCELCGKIFPCPDDCEDDPCPCDFEFGHCSKSCKELHRELMYGNPSSFEKFFVLFLVKVVCLASYLPDKYLELYEKRDKRRWDNKMATGYKESAERDLAIAKESEELGCYSHKCKLCGEEVVWSILDHLIDKHPELPEVFELSKKINDLWKKFVESS